MPGHGLNAHIIADGGCTTSGDIVKSQSWCRFCNDWWNVSGHDECDGEPHKWYNEILL